MPLIFHMSTTWMVSELTWFRRGAMVPLACIDHALMSPGLKPSAVPVVEITSLSAVMVSDIVIGYHLLPV